MAKKNKAGTSRSILNLLFVVPSIISFAGNLVSLVQAEIHEMRRNIFWMVVLLVFSTVLLSTLWMGLMALLYIFFLSLNVSSIISIVFILLLNLFLLVITCLCATLVKNKIGFPETKEVVRKLF